MKNLLAITSIVLASSGCNPFGENKFSVLEDSQNIELSPPAGGTFFNSDTNFQLSLTSSFEKVLSFQTEKGILSYVSNNGETKSLEVEISVRGHSSLTEGCRFPKLEIEFLDLNSLIGTLFEGMKELKIGTHCGVDDFYDPTIEDFGNMVAHELTTHRQSFVYKMLSILGIPAQRSRPLSITYRSEKGFGIPSYNTEVTKDGFIFEKPKATSSRLGYKYYKGEDGPRGSTIIPGEVVGKIDLKFAAYVYFFEALVGNTDFSLPLKKAAEGQSHRMHNMGLLETENGFYLPMPNDWDRASIVTGTRMRERDLRDKLGTKYNANETLLYNQQLSQLLEVESQFSQTVFTKTTEYFLTKTKEMETQLETYPVDREKPSCSEPNSERCISGYENILVHLKTFCKVLKEFK